MFLLDLQSLVGQSPGPETSQAGGGGGGGSSKASESVRLPRSEATTVQAMMDLALPRFAGLGDGPRQIHKTWVVSADSPASPDAGLADTSGAKDCRGLSSPCLNLEELCHRTMKQ